ncbi:MAG: SsrA-binding protein SmpB [Candidatus Acetothermia bacterium]|nr:SsrA-binding protein SmpB [Candidatus Bipolaricaulota bacterium]
MGRTVATNKRARRNYDFEEFYEAGIVLRGTEVKSLREGRCSLKDGYAAIKEEEAFLYNVHIARYKQGNRENHRPRRTRKLLLRKPEIKRLIGKIQQKGYSLIPLKVYFKNGYAKVKLGLGKGKKDYDKRQKIKEKDQRRRMEKQMKEYNRRA